MPGRDPLEAYDPDARKPLEIARPERATEAFLRPEAMRLQNAATGFEGSFQMHRAVTPLHVERQ